MVAQLIYNQSQLYNNLENSFFFSFVKTSDVIHNTSLTMLVTVFILIDFKAFYHRASLVQYVKYQ